MTGHLATPEGTRVRKLERGAGEPLWKQLQADLVRRLRSGEFDNAFPGELALGDAQAVRRHTSLYNELANRTGIVLDHGSEDIRAINPSAAERGVLHCPADAAVFSIVRQGSAQNRVVEWLHTLVRGDRFALSASFSAHSGYQLAPSGTALTQAW